MLEHNGRPWREYWVLEDAETHKVKEFWLILKEDSLFTITELKYGL